MKASFVKYFIWLHMASFLLGGPFSSHAASQDFVYLTDVDARIIENPRYFTSQNFLGRPVMGYTQNRIFCTKEAADQLKLAQDELIKSGYYLVVYDAYRPQCAVDAFIGWAADEADQVAKELYYPTIDKKDVFKLGYVSAKSSHSRGSTFDLTLIKKDHQLKGIELSTRFLTTGEKIPFLDDNTVDMGSSFDLFHEASHHDSSLITEDQLFMRNFLRAVMQAHGFKDYHEEWWHYTLEKEPFPDTYFNFTVESTNTKS